MRKSRNAIPGITPHNPEANRSIYFSRFALSRRGQQIEAARNRQAMRKGDLTLATRKSPEAWEKDAEVFFTR